jgi:hypothetical protein
VPVRGNLYVQDYRALIFGLAGFFGILGLDLIEQSGRRHAAAYAENPAANTAAFAGSKTATLAGAYAAT